MKISKLPHIDPLWGYLELKDGSLVALPKQAIEELQAENEQLKKEAADYHQLQWQHDALIDENEKMKRSLAFEKRQAENWRDRAEKLEHEKHPEHFESADHVSRERNGDSKLEDDNVDLGTENHKLKERIQELEAKNSNDYINYQRKTQEQAKLKNRQNELLNSKQRLAGERLNIHTTNLNSISRLL